MENNYVKLSIIGVVLFALGGITAYFILPTKTITQTIEVEKKVKTKTHQVMVAAHGVITTTTDTSIDEASDTNSKTVTEINPKRFMLAPVIGYTMQGGSVSYGILALATVYGPLGITGGGLWNRDTKTSTVLGGINISF